MQRNKVKTWIEQNLVMQEEARTITGQTTSAFNQSVQNGKILPFVEFGTIRKTRLYLREDLEAYKVQKRTQR
ncbi:hypothetical protein ACT7C8_17725 [Bacillus cereus]|jgi:hypothetical protein|uniref:Uncharacterized protein n=1 Tax=Bacillus thuringiensis TaxID=1428 RepID=A0A9W3X4J5_BACTU|nr:MULTISPECIES: hypothetical protein [Bacillus cereus group]ANS52485.1 hypothetical protein BT246_71950 [Bacillus thuringiensis]MBG9503875.1 hypothetical protein [Bacillus thuringiensis]MBG9510211.1 hypothetical protein [Bacillus thuringiensis]MBH0340490.1 hypothetical protein [Bacillus thuringiensis]MBU4642787.1 hypothetical protein [Bacillus toyonensis]